MKNIIIADDINGAHVGGLAILLALSRISNVSHQIKIVDKLPDMPYRHSPDIPKLIKEMSDKHAEEMRKAQISLYQRDVIPPSYKPKHQK